MPKAAERQRIMEVLEQCNGNRTRTAKLLGISVRIPAHRLAEYDAPPTRRLDGPHVAAGEAPPARPSVLRIARRRARL